MCFKIVTPKKRCVCACLPAGCVPHSDYQSQKQEEYKCKTKKKTRHC
uniref:Uncharacterized protein n=1 Tax=Anguilla anguilla TaxID=7936 RepID=A0A0E9WEV0_ANGAN